jgi:hypothetical protein
MRTDDVVIEAVKLAFQQVPKPPHFTHRDHCEECAEHDNVLQSHDRETLGLEQLANPGWDPLCFCSAEGKAYYMPTLVSCALRQEPEGVSPYWQQLLFHLEGDGPDNALVAWCSTAQRQAIAIFLEHLIESRADAIERYGAVDDILKVHGYWTMEKETIGAAKKVPAG